MRKFENVTYPISCWCSYSKEALSLTSAVWNHFLLKAGDLDAEKVEKTLALNLQVDCFQKHLHGVNYPISKAWDCKIKIIIKTSFPVTKQNYQLIIITHLLPIKNKVIPPSINLRLFFNSSKKSIGHFVFVYHNEKHRLSKVIFKRGYSKQLLIWISF